MKGLNASAHGGSAAARRFLTACRGEKTDKTPVWFMRQAGRYLKEYRTIRAGHGILEICKTPELAAEVTIQPVKSLGVDAAILFSDILLPLEPMGIHLEFAKGEGPILHNPIRSLEDVQRLRIFDPGVELSFVGDAIRLIRRKLKGQVPLIGFAGAPFTLASYLIEGGRSDHYLRTKQFMVADGEAWKLLMQKLSAVTMEYLKFQVSAGAQAVQIFDSWAGTLSPEDYRNFAQPYSRTVFNGLKATDVPTIHFGTGTGGFLETFSQTGGDVVGVDWRVDLHEAWRVIGAQRAIQGNLDPATLFRPLPELRKAVQNVLDQARGRPGHIFNLGHGILPETPEENVRAVVDFVHMYKWNR